MSRLSVFNADRCALVTTEPAGVVRYLRELKAAGSSGRETRVPLRLFGESKGPAPDINLKTANAGARLRRLDSRSS